MWQVQNPAVITLENFFFGHLVENHLSRVQIHRFAGSVLICKRQYEKKKSLQVSRLSA